MTVRDGSEFCTRDAAIRSEREYWLPQLEQWHAAADDGWIASILKREIKRLRRALGIKRTPELVREQARRRVQAYRERRRQHAEGA